MQEKNNIYIYIQRERHRENRRREGEAREQSEWSNELCVPGLSLDAAKAKWASDMKDRKIKKDQVEGNDELGRDTGLVSHLAFPSIASISLLQAAMQLQVSCL